MSFDKSMAVYRVNQQYYIFSNIFLISKNFKKETYRYFIESKFRKKIVNDWNGD